MQAKLSKNCYHIQNNWEDALETFRLDERLARDSVLITQLGLCQMRLQNDKRWPWIVLVPQRNDKSELFELTPLDQALVTFETNQVASALKQLTGATKINVGALGNIVRQLHVHIIARKDGDECWPGPIWGHGTAVPYADDDRHDLMKKLAGAL
ncbi:HIT domain-containing protein [Agrobacterium sp. rho-8.1]|nr:HIT family protein [Agrobacterium sp. rho-8.1]